MSDEGFLCPACGRKAPVDFSDDEWLCPKCDHLWLGEVVRGEQSLISDTMAVRDDDGTYGLYELWYVDDPDNAVVVELRSGLSRADAEQETSNVLDEPPGFGLLG